MNEPSQWKIYKLKTNAYKDATKHWFWIDPKDPNNNFTAKGHAGQFYRREIDGKDRETVFVKKLTTMNNGEGLYLIAQTSSTEWFNKKYHSIPIDDYVASSLKGYARPHGHIIPQNIRLATQSEFNLSPTVLSSPQGFIKPSLSDEFDKKISYLSQSNGRDKIISLAKQGLFDNLSEGALKDLISLGQFNTKELKNKFEFDPSLTPKGLEQELIPSILLNQDEYSFGAIKKNIEQNYIHSKFPNETPLILKDGSEEWTKQEKLLAKKYPNFEGAIEVNSKSTNNGSNSSNDNEPSEA